MVGRAFLPEPAPPQTRALFHHQRSTTKTNPSEAALARGGKVTLSGASLGDLLLIPKLSEKHAAAILAQQKEILQKARSLPPQKRSVALELVHGIGPKTAQRISNYLELR
jgi:DNA uptake protein ComE-like DNA-binding protein